MTTPTDVLVERRTRGWVPREEWGPECRGCGSPEYRIDGYCSFECRDYHSDEDIATLAARVRDLEGALREIAEMRIPGSGRLSAWAGFAQMLQQLALAALPEKGSEL